jgi:TPR repeat protein
MFASTAQPGFAAYADGRKAFDDGDYTKVIKQLEPLAQKDNGLAQAFLGFAYEQAGDQHDDVKATLWLVRAAQSDASVDGKIVSFDCGDNCYLTVKTKDGQEVGLCVAPECDPWNTDSAMPEALIGKSVKAMIGIGERYMDDGSFVDHALSFRKVTLKK